MKIIVKNGMKYHFNVSDLNYVKVSQNGHFKGLNFKIFPQTVATLQSHLTPLTKAFSPKIKNPR